MREETYLTGIYSLKAYTVGELEEILNQRFAGRPYKAVCDVINGLIRVYAPREEREYEVQ